MRARKGWGTYTWRRTFARAHTGSTLKEICHLFRWIDLEVQCFFFPLLNHRIVTRKEGPGWERTIKGTWRGSNLFLLCVCLIETPHSMPLWSCQAASPWIQSDAREVHNALSRAPPMSIFFHSWINSCLYFGFFLLLLALLPSICLWQGCPKCLL